MSEAPPGDQGAGPGAAVSPTAALVGRVEWLRRRMEGEDPEGIEPQGRCAAELELQGRLGLDDLDMAILWTAAVAEIDPLFPLELRRMHADGSRDQLDGESLVVLHGATIPRQLEIRRRLAPGSRLVSEGLLRLQDLAHVDRRMKLPVRVAPSVLRLLAGEAAGEDPLGGAAEWVESGATLADVVLPAEVFDRALALTRAHETALMHLRETSGKQEGSGLVLFFFGPPGTGKTLLAEALARDLGRKLLLVRADRLTADPARADARLADLFLEARLHDAIVFFDECDALVQAGSGLRAEHLHELERFDGVVILAANQSLALDAALQRRICWVAHFPIPDADARAKIWRLHLDRLVTVCLDPGVQVEALAGRYALSGGYIRNAVNLALHHAVARDRADPLLRDEDLHAGALAQLRGDVGHFTRPVAGRLGLEDLVVPGEIHAQVLELLEACRQRDRFLYELGMARRLPTSTGIVALFSGEPGTGKTLCAEILCAELRRPLHRVHIPSLVSKYVGDTEKNITRLFELVRGNEAVLLFDEADSLFAGRTRVESSTDRFANMEVNQLLQEIERHDGIVLLTTNLQTSLDTALARRILFRIDFPFPGLEERARIWARLLPADAADPADPPDPRALAKIFEIAGGNIRNAVVRGCYRALTRGAGVGQATLVEVGEQECAALGKVVRVPGAAPPGSPRPARA